MQFIMFREKRDKAVTMKGIVDGAEIRRIHGSFFQGYSISEEVYKYTDISVLPPIMPSNIFCLGRAGVADGYIKSISSIGISGDVVRIPLGCDKISCMPRLALVTDIRNSINKKILGYAMMLDFFIAHGGNMISSIQSYTTLGDTIDTNVSNISNFAINACELHPPKLCDISDIEKQIKLYPGDIVALPLGEPFSFHRGDTVTMTHMERRIEVSIK